jgi:branched-chain amino acid transport system ATP-binding protein
MLAIGRALLAKPRLLMLDEPSLGLSPILVKDIFRVIKELNEEKISILLVEQNVRLALNISHRGFVLDKGMIVMSGTPGELMEEDKVKESYLGEGKGKYVARRKLWAGIL